MDPKVELQRVIERGLDELRRRSSELDGLVKHTVEQAQKIVQDAERNLHGLAEFIDAMAHGRILEGDGAILIGSTPGHYPFEPGEAINYVRIEVRTSKGTMRQIDLGEIQTKNSLPLSGKQTALDFIVIMCRKEIDG